MSNMREVFRCDNVPVDFDAIESAAGERFISGDYFAVWELAKEGPHGTYHEYAIYNDKWAGGQLICLADRGACALVLCNNKYAQAIADIFRQEALDAGFPPVHPTKGVTWRQIRDKLNEFADDVLDMPATAWLDTMYDYEGCDGEYNIAGLDPFDSSQPIGWNNRLCINVKGLCK